MILDTGKLIGISFGIAGATVVFLAVFTVLGLGLYRYNNIIFSMSINIVVFLTVFTVLGLGIYRYDRHGLEYLVWFIVTFCLNCNISI